VLRFEHENIPFLFKIRESSSPPGNLVDGAGNIGPMKPNSIALSLALA
jgi:hypothetical protein